MKYVWRAEGEAAEVLIAGGATAADPVPVDPSHYLDLVTVAMTDGTTGEMDAPDVRPAPESD